MESRLLATFTFQHPSLGSVTVTPRRTSTCFRARLTPAGTIAISIPFGISLAEFNRLVARNLPRLESLLTLTPTGPTYGFDWTYFYPEGTITINPAPSIPSKALRLTCTASSLSISAGSDIDFSAPHTKKAISDLLKRGAALPARHILLPLAKEIADRLNIHGIIWEISNGNHTLGSCFASERRIRLSRILLFLPPELREFVIYHELAHLTHADHSEAFHRLCNNYCNGREKLLISALKNWQWPVIR